MSGELVRLIEKFEAIAVRRYKSSESEPIPIFVREPHQVSTSSRIALKEVQFNNRDLGDTTLTGIIDFNMYALDETHVTRLLKNTSYSNYMLLDRIEERLPDYRGLKCMSFSNNTVHFQFKNPLDKPEVIRLIGSHDSMPFMIKAGGPEVRGGGVSVHLYDAHLLDLADYGITLPYRSLMQSEVFELGLQAATELVTRIHQDRLFRKDVRTIYFAEYQPIFELLFPELFEDTFTDLLTDVRGLVRAGKLIDSPDFRETLASKRTVGIVDKRYSYRASKERDHITYIVVNPHLQEMYIKLGSHFDYERIEDMLGTSDCSLAEGVWESNPSTLLVSKGASTANRMNVTRTKSRDIVGRNKETLATFEGNSCIKFYLGRDDDTFERAVSIFSQIYYQRFFYTWNIPAELHDSDVTQNERMVIKLADMLAGFYTTFLQVGEEQRRLAEHMGIQTPLGWVHATMAQSPNKSVEGRVHYVLNDISKRTDPVNFHRDLAAQYHSLEQLESQWKILAAETPS